MINNLFKEALDIGRPPNIRKLFPNSKALIVSGSFIDKVMLNKKKSMCLAINGRNIFIIKGALKAAQKANSALIIEISKSEGGSDPYCSINYWNIARIVDSICNEMCISIPVAIHADHYTIKNNEDIIKAKTEIPTLFESGITSIAIDASHLPDDKNLLTNIELHPLIPSWAGFETEIGEIKGKIGLSTEKEALFLIQGLNAHNIHPNWLAINNGTVHGIEPDGNEIQIELTLKIHNALSKYNVSGAQHGTSGNSFSKLRKIALSTKTTKANIATTLQMVSWGLKINSAGNPIVDENGNFIKVKNHGVTSNMWNQMTTYAKTNNLDNNNYKKLNLPFETKLLSLPIKIKNRIIKDISDYTYKLITEIANTSDTSILVIKEIIKTKSYNPGHQFKSIENQQEWTPELIKKRASEL